MAALMGGLLTGCLKNTYTTGQPMGGAIHTLKATYFVLGLVGDARVDLDQLCPGGVAWFQNRLEPIDAVITVATLTLVAPLTIEVRCASGQAWLAVPDAAENISWIYPLDAEGKPVHHTGPTLALGAAQ